MGRGASVDQPLRKTTLIDRPFGGKILLAVGDPQQTAPVVPKAGKCDTIPASIRSGHLWPAFHILCLHAPIRNVEVIQYAEFVDAKLGYDSNSVPLHMIRATDSIESTIQYLFLPEVLADPDKRIWSSFLSPLN